MHSVIQYIAITKMTKAHRNFWNRQIIISGNIEDECRIILNSFQWRIKVFIFSSGWDFLLVLVILWNSYCHRVLRTCFNKILILPFCFLRTFADIALLSGVKYIYVWSMLSCKMLLFENVCTIHIFDQEVFVFIHLSLVDFRFLTRFQCKKEWK